MVAIESSLGQSDADSRQNGNGQGRRQRLGRRRELIRFGEVWWGCFNNTQFVLFLNMKTVILSCQGKGCIFGAIIERTVDREPCHPE